MPFASKPMRLAAIDLGTNSFHMIIAEVKADMSFLVIDRLKEMIRIGDGSITTKQLTDRAMAQGLETLQRFRKFAEQRGVETRHILAFATSAIREAKNGGSYMELIPEQIGIRTEIISGEEEARLIYLAVRRAIDIGDKKALMIDAGGGSVELMLGDSKNLFLCESHKMGVARMHERLITTDPISDKERTTLQDFFMSELRPFAKKIDRLRGFDMAIASSGTAENIAAMIRLSEEGEYSGLNGVSFSRKSFLRLYDKLLKMNAFDRKSIPGLDPKRTDLIVPGLILFEVFMRLFDLKEIIISAYALREGIVIDYLSKNIEQFRLIELIADPRRRSVVELARRCYSDETRSSHIAHLSLRLFDELRELHQLDLMAHELLEYAALLHNIGYFISPSGHHKHSQYIIQNGELRGFTPEEIQIISQVARYHRKSLPKPEHQFYQALSPKNKYAVRVMASILRIGNALDRTHRSNVRDVKVKFFPKKIELRLIAHQDAEIEIWAVSRVKDMFEDVFQRELVVSAEPIAD
jgi:exopolyphosphatase / guanosine-5'-triphosphate,3'-diphosphate pyrophosphatase